MGEVLTPGLLSLLPYTSGPRAQGWHAPGHNHPGSAPAPQPPSLPPVCCLSHSNHSIVHRRLMLERPFLQAESLFPARRAELRRNQGAQRQAWILAFGMTRPHSDTCRRRLLRCLFSHGRLMGATQLAWQLAAQTLPRSSSTRVSLRVLYWEGFGAGLG